MVLGRRELSAILLAVAAILFYLMLLSTAPSEAQTGGQDDSCDVDEDLVETFTGTQDQITPEFEIVGPEWRFILEATATTQARGNVSVSTEFNPDNPGSGFASVSVDPEFNPTDNDSSNIIDGPGTFSLDIDANGAEYTIVVCESASQNGGEQTTQNPTTVRNPTTVNGNDSPQNRPRRERTREVINVPRRPLPPSGGASLPVYGVVGGFVLTGAGLLALGLVIRRGSQR